jgi:hypothetical protein
MTAIIKLTMEINHGDIIEEEDYNEELNPDF